MKKIAVIIVTFNNKNSIEKCLNSFPENRGKDAEFFITDNNSSDKTLSILNKIKRRNFHLISNKTNTGFAAGVNQSIKQALQVKKFDYFLLLNPDAWLEKNCLKYLFEEIRSFDIISPVIKNPAGRIIFRSGVIKKIKMRTIHDNNKSPEYLTGACLLIRRRVFERIGLFDERFFLYYEDADFCLRARRNGFKIKISEKTFAYHEESSSSNSETKNYHLVKSGLFFFHKHFPFYLKPYFWLIFYLRLF
jgi:GT2 family glycosyltransferase